MAKSPEVKSEKKLNKKPCDNTKTTRIKKLFHKIADRFAVSTPGGVSEAMAKVQDKTDYWIELVGDQAAKDIAWFKKLIRITFRIIGKWVSVSRPGGLSGIAAAAVNRYDFVMNVLADNIVFQSERLWRAFNRLCARIWKNRILCLKYFTVTVILTMCTIAVFNHVTGYEYSYNGRALGLVKNQEDALKVLDIASKGLTSEYGVDVQIDPKEDITFRRVVIVDRTVDSMDEVLRKFTYMQDTKATAYAIYVDGRRTVIVDSGQTAKEILQSLKDKYVDPEKADTYDRIYYGQKIKIKQIDTTLGRLMNRENAIDILDRGESQVRYTVQLGDTVKSITDSFAMKESLFYDLNPEIDKNDGALEEGSKVTVVYKTPKVTVITEKTVTYDKKIKYKVKKVKSKKLYKGVIKVRTKGKYGKKEITAVVTKENGEEISRDILREKTIKKPVTKVVLVGTKKRPATVGSGDLINPCPAGYQSSGFGYRWGRLHRGVDLACAAGNNIYAADGGTVITAAFNYSYGYYIKIDHKNGMVTTYAHCSRLLVSEGDKVYKGENIALVGNTGNSTGAHCHFEVEVDGSLKNPRNYF